MDQAPLFSESIVKALAQTLAERLPDLFANSPALQAEFDEWYRDRHGITYTEHLRQTGQESPYQVRRRQVTAHA